MNQDRINKLVDETLNSADGTGRAEAPPYLLTRINARISNRENENGFWSWSYRFLTRPATALACLFIILLVNIAILINNNAGEGYDNAQNLSASKDEYAISLVSVYEFENQEP